MIKVDIFCDPANILKPNETKIKKIIKTVYENEKLLPEAVGKAVEAFNDEFNLFL